ncbi:MAG: DUF2721 domain-containing protein [Leptolyngbyaceae cyanobacterium bins.302]|nr:DUF2721 domain-containing protein [Leptolyngbyaceae cyanobacterium bins.302]
MSVEQTTQLIQLILNSVLMSVACALVLGGLTTRHAKIHQQLHNINQPEFSSEIEGWQSKRGSHLHRSQISQVRNRIKRLRYRYQISRYSVLSGYYALLFAIVSCFALVLRGIMNWNGLIPIALGLFVISIATLLVSIGLTLVDWHLSDRALLEEVQQLLSFGSPDYPPQNLPSRHLKTKPQSAMLRSTRQRMRVG